MSICPENSRITAYNFALDLPQETRAEIVRSGIVKINRPRNRSKSCHQYASDFSIRFYKSVCAHALAIASRRYAFSSRDQPTHGEPNKVASELSDIVYDVWNKEAITLNGCRVALNLEARLDCIEVYDFLYLFLLRKLLPYRNLDSWAGYDIYRYPYDYAAGRGTISHWYTLLEHSRDVLQPWDLLDLTEHKSWSADHGYPPDKSKYLRLRGFYDWGGYSDADWFTTFSRLSMICCVNPEQPLEIHRHEEMPCWWDQVRSKAGSPFRSNFLNDYKVQLAKITPHQAHSPLFLGSSPISW